MNARVVVRSGSESRELSLQGADFGASLASVLARHGFPLNTRCGQRGLCSGCLVAVESGQLDPAPRPADYERGLLRACRFRPSGPRLEIAVPPRSLVSHVPQIATSFRAGVSRAADPLAQLIPVEIPRGAEAETIERTLQTAARRTRPVRSAVAPDAWAGCREALLRFREDHWEAWPERGEGGRPDLGLAIDIGTTTVVVLLVDLNEGAILAEASDFNRQMHSGDDVLTRINLCLTDPANVGRLQADIAGGTLVPLIRKVLGEAGGTGRRLACASVAGNTTMLHLFAGVNPARMGMAPFTAEFLGHKVVSSGEAGLGEFGLFDVHLLPGAAAYVGADLCAGLLCTGMAYEDGPSLLVDVGTNGEMLFKSGGKILGCATAAGPAFEGSGLTSGMRAGTGVISKLALSGPPLEIRQEIIGGGSSAIGLCGTAYVDLLAEGRRVGLLNEAGRFDGELGPGEAERWFVAGEYGRVLQLDRAHQVGVSEPDIAKLLQAKAAISAGVRVLLKRAGCAAGEVRRLYLAGGFGLHLSVENAIGCGMLPGFDPGQVEVVGNTSLGGAFLALGDASFLDEAVRVHRQIEIVELNLDPEFEDLFIESLSL